MHHDTMTFQLATHYLSRIAIRLECLYETIYQASEETHPVIHHNALNNILEILQIIVKPELKSRFLKELMRIEHAVNKHNITLSTELCSSLHNHIQRLSQMVGLFGEGIQQDTFLQIFKVTFAGNNTECEMYSPQLLFWLESSPSQRQQDLLLWLSHLHGLYSTVNFYLKLLRSTADFQCIVLYNGFYQRAFSPNTSCQLIMLRISKSFGLIPRMQIGHHGLNLRLCEAHSLREIKETEAKFDLAICQL